MNGFSPKSIGEERIGKSFVTGRQDIWTKFDQVHISDRASIIERRRRGHRARALRIKPREKCSAAIGEVKTSKLKPREHGSFRTIEYRP